MSRANFVAVERCYACLSYSHKANDNKGNITCYIPAVEYKSTDCENKSLQVY